MPLMPADVHNVAFSKPRIGKRGYDEDEVDAFLDVVEAEIARVIEQNNQFRNQLAQLDQQLRAVPGHTVPSRDPRERPRPVVTPVQAAMREQAATGGDQHVQAATVLDLAREMTERLTGEAKAEAEVMLSQARAASEWLLSDAMTRADGLVNEARTRAETLLHAARSKADSRDRQSREKAASVERDAACKSTEIVAALNQEKRILEKEIDELRAFERTYRTRLTIYLGSQLNGLAGGGPIGPTDSMGDQQGFRR
jgi:DivIVA domain-containing protein